MRLLQAASYLPLAIAAEALGAALGFLIARDYRHSFYWFATAVISIAGYLL